MSTTEPTQTQTQIIPPAPAALVPENGTKKPKLTGRAFYTSLGSPRVVIAPMVDRSEFAWRMLTRSFMPGLHSTDNGGNPVLAYSPMFHARLFNETAGYRAQHFEALKPDGSTRHLDGNPAFDRPLIVQFCANDPAELLAAARQVQDHCDAVDLNLGCPQGIAKRGHYGAFLQEDWDLIWRLIRTLRDGLDVPVTAKFRIQESKEKTLEYARMILDAGASVITVHGRRREQKGHNTGLADWGYIRYLRDKLPGDTVIFANGNVLNYGDVARCLEETGADAVMSAEGNLSDPTIFAGPPGESVGEEERKRMYWVGRDGRGGYRLDFVLRRYMDIIHEHVLEREKPVRKPLYVPGDPPSTTTQPPSQPEPEPQSQPPPPEADNEGKQNEEQPHPDEPPKKKLKPTPETQPQPQPPNRNQPQNPKQKQKQKKNYTKPTSPNLTAMQGHLFQLLRPLISHKPYTHIRDALARCRAGDIDAFENVVRMVEGAVEEGVRGYFEHGTLPEGYIDHEEGGVVGEEGGMSDVERTRRLVRRPWWVCQPYVRPLPEEAAARGALREKQKKENQGECGGDGCAEPAKENVEPESETANEAANANVNAEKAG